MTVGTIHQFVIQNLDNLYSKSEASNVSKWLLSFYLKIDFDKILLYSDKTLTYNEELEILNGLELLNKHVPIQYITNESFFCGHTFYVNEHVLIPRPETEKMIAILQEYAIHFKNPCKLLDIGTGSACIPITLKKKFPQWHIEALDISCQALSVARHNSSHHKTQIFFHQYDFLKIEDNFSQLSEYNILISNPPYIPLKEKDSLMDRVSKYEPHLALFVPDETPLVFVEKIKSFAQNHLISKGIVLIEIHPLFSEKIYELFKTSTYFQDVEIIKDDYQNNRFVLAKKI